MTNRSLLLTSLLLATTAVARENYVPEGASKVNMNDEGLLELVRSGPQGGGGIAKGSISAPGKGMFSAPVAARPQAQAEEPQRVGLAPKSLMATCTDGVFFGQSAFRPFEIECPPEGESRLVQLSFDTPDPNHGLAWSVAASYGENKDQTEGLDVFILATDDNGFIEQGPVSAETWMCSSAIYASNDNKVCKTSAVQGVAEGTAAVAVTGQIVITNNGGCEGNVYIESALDDMDPTGNFHMHKCTRDMQEATEATASQIGKVTAGPETEEKGPYGPVVLFKLCYAVPVKHAREPTEQEVKDVLCRTEPYFSELIRDHMEVDGVELYAHYLGFTYTPPTGNEDFSIDIHIVANVTNMDTGEIVDASDVVDYMDLDQEQIVDYVKEIARDTTGDDVFKHAWGWKVVVESKANIVAAGIPDIPIPFEHTCQTPEQAAALEEAAAAAALEDAEAETNRAMGKAAPKDPICVVRADTESRPRKYFQPLVLPCPEVGEQAVVSFAHTMMYIPDAHIDVDPAVTVHPEIEVDVSVAYGENLDQIHGLKAKVHHEPTDPNKRSCPVNTASTSHFVSAQSTSSHGVDYEHTEPVEHQVVVQVLNEAAEFCAGGTMQVEIALYEPPHMFDEHLRASSTHQPGQCMEPLAVDTRCSEEIPEITDDAICTATTMRDGMGRSTSAKLYPTLELECPAEGEAEVFHFAFLMPSLEGQLASMVQVSMGLSHDAGKEGLWLEVVEGMDRCTWAPGLTGTPSTQCPEWFDEKAQHCGSFPHYTNPGDEVYYTVRVVNQGGCEGTIQVDVALDDRGMAYEEPSECKRIPERVPCETFGDAQAVGAPNRGSSPLSLFGDHGHLGNDPNSGTNSEPNPGAQRGQDGFNPFGPNGSGTVDDGSDPNGGDGSDGDGLGGDYVGVGRPNGEDGDGDGGERGTGFDPNDPNSENGNGFNGDGSVGPNGERGGDFPEDDLETPGAGDGTGDGTGNRPWANGADAARDKDDEDNFHSGDVWESQGSAGSARFSMCALVPSLIGLALLALN